MPGTADLTALRASTTYRVLVDFDGTVTLDDSVDAILSAFASSEWLQIEHAWTQGEIGSGECMRRQTELVRATPTALHAFIEKVAVDEALAEVIDVCTQAATDVAIVSDGYDYVIEHTLGRMRVRCTVFSGRLSHVENDRWRFEMPHARGECLTRASTCKCAIAAPRRAIVIGDGRSDFCVAEHAAFVFAKGRLARHCRERGIPHREITRLREVAAPLADLLHATTTTTLAIGG
jgi:2-hydroxy-3-keto-5-methylthiopentenyl-1-phosphate phosphatase